MMSEGGGNYRARLAARNYAARKKKPEAFSTPPPNVPVRGGAGLIGTSRTPSNVEEYGIKAMAYATPNLEAIIRGIMDPVGTTLGAADVASYFMPQTQATRVRNQFSGGSYFDSLMGAGEGDVEQAIEIAGLIPAARGVKYGRDVLQAGAEGAFGLATRAGRRLGPSGLGATAGGISGTNRRVALARRSTGGSAYLNRLSTPVLQRAIQTASMEGKRVGGSIVEEAASQGVRFGQSGVARAGRAAEDELFEFIDDLERIGVKPQTANRLLRGFALYADDPVEAMAGLGEDVSRTTMGAKEALIERLLTRLGARAENEFF